MKAKSKILLTSLMSIAFASSLIAGSTYALFTSKSEVNIAVTSGKVKVDAKVNKASLALTSMEEEQEGTTWANGGVAGFTDQDELKLDYITPGDKATFTIDVTNESNVNIKYKVDYKVEGDLADALEVTFDSLDDTWTNWLITEEQEKTINVSVELPESVGNEYQDSTATIAFVVEAVQGNASVSNITEELAAKMEDGTYTADGRKTPEGMTLDFSGEKCYVRIADEEAMMYYGHYFDRKLAYTARQEDIANGVVEKSALEKKYFSGYNIWYQASYGPMTDVVIENDMNFGGTEWNKPLEFYGVVVDGQNHVFKNLNIKATGNAGMAGLFSGSTTLQNFTVMNVHANAVEATGNSSCGVVSASTSGSIRNVTVKNSSAIGGKYTGGIVGYIYGTVSNCNVVNVKVDTFYKGGGIIGYQCADNGKFNHIMNNTLESVSVSCTEVLAGKTPGLGVFVGNMNCDGNIIGNVATSFEGATSLIGVKDSHTHETVKGNVVNGEEMTTIFND